MCLPPNDAATATDPATLPAALATAANPLAPITGTRAPKVGAKAPKPAAIAGAAKPVYEQNEGKKIILYFISYEGSQQITFQPL